MRRPAAVALALTLGIGFAAALAWREAASGRGEPAAVARADERGQRVVAQAQIVPIDGIIEVRPLAEGKVLRVLVQPGDRVETHQLLAEIENDLPRAALQQREADVKAAAERLALAAEGARPEDRAALAAAAEAARSESDLAADRLQRQRQLFDQGFVSPQSVIEAERAASAARARAREARMRAQAGDAGGRPAEVRAARQQLAAAVAVLNQTKVALSRTRIDAPIGGIIMARSVNPGDIIGSNVTSPTLFKIVDPKRVEVRVEIEDSLADRVELGQPIAFVLPGSTIRIGEGTVSRIAPQVEKRTIGADDARIRADSMIRPAWSDYRPLDRDGVPPVNFRLEAWITPSYGQR
jgi:multidrug resistance efflux pump